MVSILFNVIASLFNTIMRALFYRSITVSSRGTLIRSARHVVVVLVLLLVQKFLYCLETGVFDILVQLILITFYPFTRFTVAFSKILSRFYSII